MVFEFWSPGNTFRQFVEKVETHGRLGVKEYYLYDPQRDDFLGWHAGPAGLVPVAVEGTTTSPLLGVRFEHAGGGLKVFHADGRPFRSFTELARDAEAAKADAEAAKADAEAAKADAEAAKADAEAARSAAERLAAKLRALGIDPDAP